jgi:hypothetical protein
LSFPGFGFAASRHFRVRGALDEALGKAETGAEEALAASHFAVVGLVVVTGEVEEAVEDEDLDFSGEGMALLGGLTAGGGNADGKIAGN